ncbi:MULTISPECIES: TetR/AcrR family transcriptional regulator [unclassified Leifsonia]|uniref:TetR/AcrR family transcriptional regulator n=1 Tax=unclassified Leifsonia TaxID=2663824 RepID=UPI000A199832|nr:MULTISPECIES: TetR/AcrR family transcriptional regulator [unclassified Leifsonia]QIZ99281.1 TetR/AcrR family transcriptional regulator [Leifsonia sp. PS1209]
MGGDTITQPKPLRADAQRNYDKIVNVACEAFAENGVQTSLDDIAKKAGVGAGTLYRHFPTRECLLAAALVESRQGLDARATELLTRPDAGEALNDWLIDLARHLSSYDGLPDSVADAVCDPESPLTAPCSSMKVATARLLSRAQDAGAVRPDVVADDLFVFASSLAWAANKSGYTRDDLRRVLNLFVAGLR